MFTCAGIRSDSALVFGGLPGEGDTVSYTQFDCCIHSYLCDLLLAARHAIYMSTFDDKKQGFDGWNCGAITTCGGFGGICGGYGVKGKGSEITNTFNLPAGIYSVQLDFIRIDSWFV